MACTWRRLGLGIAVSALGILDTAAGVQRGLTVREDDGTGGRGPTKASDLEKAVHHLTANTKGHHRRLPTVPEDIEGYSSSADRKERLHVLNDDGGLSTSIDTADNIPSTLERLGRAVWGLILVALALACVMVPLPGPAEGAAASRRRGLSLVASFAGLLVTHWAACCLQDHVLRARYDGMAFPSAAFLVWSTWVVQLLAMAAYMSFGRQSWPPAKAFTWSILPVAMEVSRFFNWHGFLYYATAPASVAYSTASIVPTILLMALVGRGASPAASSKEPAEPILFWHSLGLGLLVTVLLGCLMASIVDRVEQFSLRNTTMSNLYYLFYVSCGAAGPVFQRLGLDSLPGVGFGQWMFTIAFFSSVASGVVVYCDTGFPAALGYVAQRPEACADVLMASVAHIGSQFFLLYIISRHGPVTLAAMMAAKEALDLLLPAYFLGLPLGSVPPHIFGACLLGSLYLARVAGALQRPAAPGAPVQQPAGKAAAAQRV